MRGPCLLEVDREIQGKCPMGMLFFSNTLCIQYILDPFFFFFWCATQYVGS